MTGYGHKPAAPVLVLAATVCVLVFGQLATPVAARHVNISLLANCDDTIDHAPVYLTKVWYEMGPENLCDTIHATFHVATIDLAPNELSMVLYKCPGGHIEDPCFDNPTEHVEHLDCDRFVNDDTGPWHMFSSSMSGSHCGDEMGDFELNTSRLRIEYLIKYLDIHDDDYHRFRLRMYFRSTGTDEARGCAHVDFYLV